jgi:anaerobic magnesium-protoporphyrin IX monomethyl ester cyclase
MPTRILLINPPYVTLTSVIGVGHQVPLGLLMVGGALLDAGHEVKLLDAERQHLSIGEIIRRVKQFSPDIVMTGHAGSTPAHPICVRMLAALKASLPKVVTVYGGVYPTFNAPEILRQEEGIDVIVRGEGEATILELVQAIESQDSLQEVDGIAYRAGNQPALTPQRTPIRNLDRYRIGWELIGNWDDYQCFGLGRAAVAQFSRGCPHRCTFCGQKDFWVKWRYRDPVKVADEIEWLYRTHDVRFVSLSDENPTSVRSKWQRLLQEIIDRRIQIHFFVSIRTSDIVRDADILHLYKEAGIQYVLLGVESAEPEVLDKIKKDSTPRQDLQACRLLKKHGIFSIVAHVVGLRDETCQSFKTAIDQLTYYDGDFVNVTYVTPHNWTPYGEQVKGHPLVYEDLSKWDYRHQVLAQKHLSPWKVFLAVKWLELRVHVRPRRLWAIWKTPDPFLRKQMIWCQIHTTMVWFCELVRPPPTGIEKHLRKYLKRYPNIRMPRLRQRKRISNTPPPASQLEG